MCPQACEGWGSTSVSFYSYHPHRILRHMSLISLGFSEAAGAGCPACGMDSRVSSPVLKHRVLCLVYQM